MQFALSYRIVFIILSLCMREIPIHFHPLYHSDAHFVSAPLYLRASWRSTNHILLLYNYT